MFDCCAFALLQVPDASVPGESNIVQLIIDSSFLSQAVLLLLLLFSITSWAITAFKFWQFYLVETQTDTFNEIFRRSSKFSDVQSVCDSLTASPLAGIFQAGYVEINAQLYQPDTSEQTQTGPTLQSFDSLDRALLRAANVEINDISHFSRLQPVFRHLSDYLELFGESSMHFKVSAPAGRLT